jgi:hypothetical protein
MLAYPLNARGYNSPKIAKFINVLLLHLVLDIKIWQTLKRQ